MVTGLDVPIGPAPFSLKPRTRNVYVWPGISVLQVTVPNPPTSDLHARYTQPTATAEKTPRGRQTMSSEAGLDGLRRRTDSDRRMEVESARSPVSSSQGRTR